MTGRNAGVRARISLLAVGAGVIASLAFAAPSIAAPPAAGANCQADGRINGRGATFANNAQRVVFEPAYRREICGPVPGGVVDAGNEPNSAERMVLYNYVGGPTGSGGGITGAICRTDAFNGTDVPYTIAQLGQLRTGTGDCSTVQTLVPPFQPSPGPYPAATDTAVTNIMSFPVAGGAVAIGFSLTSAQCGGGTAPTAIQLDSTQASRLFGGFIQTWNDAALVAIQPVGSTLANCTAPVRRWARSDNSGTTTIFKNYLIKADPSTLQCEGASWTSLAGQAGNNFPDTNAACSQITYASGNPGVITGVRDNPGSVGYGDLSEWRSLAPAVGLASVSTQPNLAAGGPYVRPDAGSASNCSFSNYTPPPGGNNGLVGLVGNAYASDASPNRSDVTFTGNYPACGFTWVLVRNGLNDGGGELSRLNANQRRTLFSYLLFALTPSTQAQLSTNFYAPLPATFANNLRNGFIANY